MMRSWREKRSTACTERSASSRPWPPRNALVIERGKFRESIYPSPRMIVAKEDPMRPRTVFAMAVTGLLFIAGLAFLGSVTSGTVYVYVRDAPANWRQLNVVFSDIQVHRADAGNDSGWSNPLLASPTSNSSPPPILPASSPLTGARPASKPTLGSAWIRWAESLTAATPV